MVSSLPQSHTGATTVLGDELDPAFFKGSSQSC